MILSDRDIRRRLESGDLDITPLDDPELQIQPASVDLRLGREFLEFERTNIPCIHPESEAEIEEYVTETIVDEDEEFILHPGDFVLGTTKERVEIPDDLLAHVEGRSSLGRLAIVVHASLPYDEQVFLWTPEGGLGFYDIGDIVENERPARAVAFDPKTLSVSTHRVTDYITNPTRRLYRVRLESGREVHVTRDHNLFTLDEEGGVRRIPSEDAVGQFVMVPDGLPRSPSEMDELGVLDLLDPGETTLYATDGSGSTGRSAASDGVRRYDTPAEVDVGFGQSDTRLPRQLSLTPEFGWMFGFYIAEGVAKRTQIQVGDADTTLLERFGAFFEQHEADLVWEEDGRVTKLTVSSAPWTKLLCELAGSGGEKTVPACAFNWPSPVLEGVLEGLLDGCGSRGETTDTLSTANPALADRAAYLGTRLGLLTSVDGPGQERDTPGSDVSDSDELWTVAFTANPHRCGQSVPVPSNYLRGLRERAGFGLEDVADAMGYASTSTLSAAENETSATVRREALERVRDTYAEAGVDTTRLDQILDGGVRFEEVVEVEATDRVEPTYDLEVQPAGQPVENFLGGRNGGIFLSNTAGLCDPGYQGQITLELSNLGAAPVSLAPDMRISQLTFTELTSPAERPYGKERGSKYQDQSGPQASRIGGDREFGGDQ